MPNAALSPTTGVSRRHGPVVEELGYPSRFVRGKLTPAPAVAAIPPRPFGDLGRASAADLSVLIDGVWQQSAGTSAFYRAAIVGLLGYLSGFDGSCWQQRWDASPLAAGETGGWPGDVKALRAGARALFCLRVIQPTVLAFQAVTRPGYAEAFRAAQNDPLLDKYFEHTDAQKVAWAHRREAAADICRLMTIQGVGFADVTPQALLYHAHQYREANRDKEGRGYWTRFAGLTAWTVLHQMGHFPADAPLSMREALGQGQLTIEELVDRYEIRSGAVRQLLIDYLARRKTDTDYSTLKTLALALAGHFWAGIEKINPAQADLRLDPVTYHAWRESIRVRNGREISASQQDGTVITVRSFYYDLHTWAADEPERWAIWVAPCPVPPGELRGLGQRRRRINERSADRTRVRQPLLPALVEHIEARYEHAKAVLERAAREPDGAEFVIGARRYRRIVTDYDRKKEKYERQPVRVMDLATGKNLNTEADEEYAFWIWAAVTTLRHSGVRIEELLELTHLSVRQYQRANGEVIALLVISPSKTDRERVIPMSAELFHVIACIIRRHTADGVTIPLLRRYDTHEKLWSPPLPYLFQRLLGTTRTIFNPNTVTLMIKRSCAELAETNPAFRGLEFTAHDFRRIFATELVNSGLPIHIGAALLGHLDIRTTRGYVAVFDEDVVRHSMEYFGRRRALRPTDEYRPVTDQEWVEFEEHFDKRKVELGSCARPYGTPCQHEHACIRCPMLHINPKMLVRIDELEADLLARRERAVAEQWAGEIDGIDLTLSFLRAKRDEARRLARRPAVNLGIPTARTSNPPEAH